MARNNPLPDPDEVIRWVARKFIEKDDDGNPVRTKKGEIQHIDPGAYELRADEDYLSVTWLGYFQIERLLAIPAGAEAFRLSLDSGKIAATSAFAVASVVSVKASCKAANATVRLLEEPVAGNDAHAAIRRFPRDNRDLLNVLASQTFYEAYVYRELKTWDTSPPSSPVVR